MRAAMFLIGLALLCATVHAELPCVSPADAVLVLDAQYPGVLTGPGLSVIYDRYTQITCEPGKRVGLWLTGPDPIFLRPMKIVGCEVGIVMDTQWQIVEGFSIVGARVGVCWQADDGFLTTTHIEATEVGVVVSGKDVFVGQSNLLHTPGGVGVQFQEDAACTCAGAV